MAEGYFNSAFSHVSHAIMDTPVSTALSECLTQVLRTNPSLLEDALRTFIRRATEEFLRMSCMDAEERNLTEFSVLCDALQEAIERLHRLTRIIN